MKCSKCGYEVPDDETVWSTITLAAFKLLGYLIEKILKIIYSRGAVVTGAGITGPANVVGVPCPKCGSRGCWVK